MKLQESITGFYYVGSNKENITKLVNIYKRGYASGNLDLSLEELTRERSDPAGSNLLRVPVWIPGD